MNPPLKDRKEDKIFTLTSEKSMQPNIWMYLFFSLLVIAVLIFAYKDMREADEPLIYYKEKYDELERSYVEIAGSYVYLLETIMSNNIDIQPYIQDYNTKSRAEYIEWLRRRIVSTQVEIDRLDRMHRK